MNVLSSTSLFAFMVILLTIGFTPYLTQEAFAVDGETITEEQTLEHDTLDGLYNAIIQIDSDTYAVAYESDAFDGKISTFDISADGKTITLVQTLEFELNFNGETSWA